VIINEPVTSKMVMKKRHILCILTMFTLIIATFSCGDDSADSNTDTGTGTGSGEAGWMRTFTSPWGAIASVAIFPDQEYVLSGGGDRSVNCWRISDATWQKTFIRHGKVVQSVAISPDGEYVISGSSDNTIKYCHVQDIQNPITLKVMFYL